MKLVAAIVVLGMMSFLAFGFLAVSAPGDALWQRWGFGVVALAGLLACIIAYRRLRAKRYDRLIEED